MTAQQVSNAFQIEVEGSPMPAVDLARVEVEDHLHLPDAFTLTIRDAARTALATTKLKIGAKVKISVISDASPAPTKLLEGEVTALEAEFHGGTSYTIVRGYDQSHRLFRGRVTESYLNMTYADVAKKVGLSTTPCWRRIQKLEEEGVIKRRVAILNPERINARVNVFVSIRTSSHSHEWLRRFSEVVQEFPEVVEFYRMSGDVDYLLRVVVPDIAAYDAFYKRLIAKIEIRDVSSSFAMEQIKYTTEMPLDYMVVEKESGAHAA